MFNDKLDYILLMMDEMREACEVSAEESLGGIPTL